MSPPFLSPFFFQRNLISLTLTPIQRNHRNWTGYIQHKPLKKSQNMLAWAHEILQFCHGTCGSHWDAQYSPMSIVLGFDLCLTSLQKLERRWVRRLASFLTKFFPVSSFTPHHLLITQTLAGTTWPYQVPFPLQTQVEALFGCTLNDNFLTGASPLSWSAACLKEKRCSLLRLVIMLLWLGRNTSTEWQLLHLNCSLSKFRRAACLS